MGIPLQGKSKGAQESYSADRKDRTINLETEKEYIRVSTELSTVSKRKLPISSGAYFKIKSTISQKDIRKTIQGKQVPAKKIIHAKQQVPKKRILQKQEATVLDLVTEQKIKAFQKKEQAIFDKEYERLYQLELKRYNEYLDRCDEDTLAESEEEVFGKDTTELEAFMDDSIVSEDDITREDQKKSSSTSRYPSSP